LEFVNCAEGIWIEKDSSACVSLKDGRIVSLLSRLREVPLFYSVCKVEELSNMGLYLRRFRSVPFFIDWLMFTIGWRDLMPLAKLAACLKRRSLSYYSFYLRTLMLGLLFTFYSKDCLRVYSEYFFL
jgi:hypothetical protein